MCEFEILYRIYLVNLVFKYKTKHEVQRICLSFEVGMCENVHCLPTYLKWTGHVDRHVKSRNLFFAFIIKDKDKNEKCLQVKCCNLVVIEKTLSDLLGTCMQNNFLGLANLKQMYLQNL